MWFVKTVFASFATRIYLSPSHTRVLQYEHDQRLRLEEMVETLAKQHSSLERQARKNLPNSLPHVPAAAASEPVRKTSSGPPGTVGAECNEVSAPVVVDGVETPVIDAAAASSSAQHNAASSNASEDDDEEFFDVMEEAEEFLLLPSNLS